MDEATEYNAEQVYPSYGAVLIMNSGRYFRMPIGLCISMALFFIVGCKIEIKKEGVPLPFSGSLSEQQDQMQEFSTWAKNNGLIDSLKSAFPNDFPNLEDFAVYVESTKTTNPMSGEVLRDTIYSSLEVILSGNQETARSILNFGESLLVRMHEEWLNSKAGQ